MPATLTQIRGQTQIKALSIYDGQVATNAAIATSKLADGALFIKSNGSVAMGAALSMGTFAIQNVGAPQNATDAATRGYVDSVAQGLDVKTECRAATTGPLTLNAITPGFVIDTTVTLSLNDRVLVKNQSSSFENGIYKVTNSGLVRTDDANSSSNFSGGAFTFVMEGYTLQKTGWVVVGEGPINVGVDPVIWSQFSGAGAYVAGNGIYITGVSIAAYPDPAGAVTVTGSGISLSLKSSDLEVQTILSVNYLSIKNNAIVEALINNGAVSLNKLASYSVDASKFTAALFSYPLANNGSNIVLNLNTGIFTNNISNQLDLVDGGTPLAKLASADTAGKIIVANASKVPSYVAMSSDATIDYTGAVTLSTSPSSYFANFAPTSQPNSSATAFTFAKNGDVTKLSVFLNGVLQHQNASGDYTAALIANQMVVTFTFTPQTGDFISASGWGI